MIIKNIKNTSVTKDMIITFMKALDKDFIPPLSTRIGNYETYIEKLFQFAEIFLALKNNRICGLVAMYCNDKKELIAYITYIGILKEYRGQGLGLKLMNMCIRHSLTEGMSKLLLETSINNTQAVKFYEKMEFLITENLMPENRIKMMKILSENCI